MSYGYDEGERGSLGFEWKKVEVGVLASGVTQVLSAAPTEIDTEGTDYSVCKCKMHVVVEHDEVGAKGCSAEALGFHRAIQALYVEGGPVAYCHAEPETRKKDQQLAKMMVSGGGKYLSYVRDVPLREVMIYSGQTYFQYEAFGAFYCYQGGIRHDYRMRMARILGPKPLIVDVMRAMNVCGRKWMQPCKVKWVSEGLYHLEELAKGRIGDGGVKLMRQLLSIVKEHGPDVRIGAGGSVPPVGVGAAIGVDTGGIDYDKLARAMMSLSVKDPGGSASLERAVKEASEFSLDVGIEEFLVFHKKVEDMCGHRVPKSAYNDLALARHAMAIVPEAEQGKLKGLSVVGEAALLLNAVTVKHREGQFVGSVQQCRTTTLTDTLLRAAMLRSPIAEYIVVSDGTTLNSRVGLLAFTAVAGVLSMYCSGHAVGQYAKSVGL